MEPWIQRQTSFTSWLITFVEIPGSSTVISRTNFGLDKENMKLHNLDKLNEIYNELGLGNRIPMNYL